MSPDDQPDKDRPTRKDDPEPRDVPETPPTEPQPVPIRDPKPEGAPEGPYIALAMGREAGHSVIMPGLI